MMSFLTVSGFVAYGLGGLFGSHAGQDIDDDDDWFDSAETVEQSPDNNRRVTVFEAIDAEAMARDFWKAVDAALAEGQKSN